MSSSSDKVYSIIKDRILTNHYLPNEYLIESAIAKEFNVSRSTVKKAMIKLESDYLVEIEANKSTMVKSITKKEVLHLLEIRERIEGLIAYKVAEIEGIADNVGIKEILGELEGMKKHLKEEDFIEHSKNNDNIHQILYDLCPNREVAKLIDQINLQLRKYNKRTILINDRRQRSYTEHKNIIDAIVVGDKVAAEMAMREHIGNIRKTVEKNYEVLFM